MFAIAATLLVLDIAVRPPGTPLQQVLHAWPSYLAYLVSFLTIGAAWLGHTALTERLARSDLIFLQINLLVLLVVAFLPFPTRLVTDALHNEDAERVAVTFYGLTLLAIRVLGSALDAYARREHLYSLREDGDEVLAGRCELCGQADVIEVHHIRSLADLNRPGQPQPLWAQVLAKRRRKSLAVCGDCHALIHREPVNALTGQVIGEPVAGKLARRVRRETVRKRTSPSRHLAARSTLRAAGSGSSSRN